MVDRSIATSAAKKKIIMEETFIQIISGQSVFTQLSEASFRDQWTDLQNSCPWATSMQSLPFVEFWYNSYLSQFKPIIVTEYSAENKLVGLLPLAVEIDTARLVKAGDNLCEYGTWLATADNGNQFITKALDALISEFPNSVLQFLFLAANTPLDWLTENNLNIKCTLRKVSRPLLVLEDGTQPQALLDKKKTRTRLKQMGRAGMIEFTQLTDSDEFKAVFDEVQTYSDLRLNATHRYVPDFNPFKKKFYFELFKVNLIHATLLKVGGKIASAQFNLYNRDQVLLGLTAISPFFAKHSPNKFHIPMLGLELIKQGVKALDLTPGGEYKDRYANSYDEVHVLTIYFNQTARRKAELERQLLTVIKKGLELAKIERETLDEQLYEIKHKLKFVSTRNIVSKLVTRVSNLSTKKREMRVYTFETENIPSIPNPKLMNRDCMEDLLKYEPTESWHLSPSAFHRLAIKRLSEENHVYTKVEAGKLVHCGWLIERQEKSFLSEVNQDLTMLPGSAALFDFFTHPQARGKGLYQAAMQQMLHDASCIPNTSQVYISVMADNVASRHAIEKIGFKYKCSLYGRK
jgi:CelD/BcsL family acetyltransferase involved in cellulose biosynthesis